MSVTDAPRLDFVEPSEPRARRRVPLPAFLARWAAGPARLVSAARASLFWALLNRQRRWIRWLIAFLIVSTTFQLLAAELLVNMVNQGIADQALPLPPFVWRFGVMAALAAIFGFAAQMCIQRIGYQLEFDMRTWLYTRIQWAELRRLDTVASGQLVTRSMTDLQLLVQLLQIFPALVGLAPVLLALALFMFILSPPLAALALVSIPVNGWLVYRIRLRLWGLSWAELNERAEVTSAIDEPVRGIRVVKAFAREAEESSRVARVALRAYRYSMTRVRLLARYSFWIRMIPFLSQGVMLLVGSWLLANKHLSLGAFLLAFQFGAGLTQLSTAFDQIASSWQYLRGAQGRLAEMLALGTRPVTEGHRLPTVRSGLRLSSVDVVFADQPVIEGFSITVAPGEVVAVTGAPGSGKSTLAAVAAGMLPPTAGQVVLDGEPIGELDPTEFRRAVRMVAEEPLLLATTLRDNLVLGAEPGTPDEAVHRALSAAAVTEVVEGLPDGLDGVVGDRGLTLSGGQRQRLGIARALVAEPRVLVLDDALSAVNPSLEVEILRRIRATYPEMAILCVTRRGGPVGVADRIVELVPPAGVLGSAGTADGLALRRRGGPPDPRLAEIVENLRLTEESPHVPETEAENEADPRLGKVLKPFRALIAAALVVVVVQTGAQVSPQALFGVVTNHARNGSGGGAGYVGVLLLAIGVVYAATSYGSQILAQRFNQGLIYLLRRRVFHRLARLGIDFYDREMPGEVATRVVNDLDTILYFLQQPAFLLVTGAAQLAVGMVIIVALAPSVFLVVIGMLALMVAVTVLQLWLGTRAFGWARGELGTVTARFEEDFEARQEIRSLGAQTTQTRRFVAASWQLRRARWWSQLINTGYAAVIQFLGLFLGVLVLWRAGADVFAGSLAVGTALSLQLLATAATQPIQYVTPYYGQFLQSRVSWARLREPFHVPILPVESPDPRPCTRVEGEVVFDHVGFSYPHTGRRVLHDVSFHVPAGRLVALVGYTGAGKSSIAKLISRTYDPDTGAVLVDGVDLRQLDLSAYRSRLGIVPQDDFVFRGTVASNIAYGNPDAGRADIELAAQAVGAFDLLAALPGGFDHPVEEEGRNLTAAQRQLVALARAWLAQPDVLILDEATSSLDVEVEDRVLAAIHASGRTTVTVTHRESAVTRADWVIVLDAGRVAEEGPLESVVGAGGAYDRLWVSAEELVPAGRGRPTRTAGADEIDVRAWDRRSLYAEARRRNIKGRSRMNVEQLLAALTDVSGNGTGRNNGSGGH